MLKTSHLQELKKRYASMYAPQPVEESETKEDHKIECPKCKGEGCEHCDGKGYHIEDEDADPVGKNEEVDEGTALQVKMALGDVGLKGTWKNNKVYVKKKDVEKAEKALKGNVIYKGKPPEVIGEEVEIQEHCGECEMGITEEVSAKEFDALKKGDTVTIEFKSSMSSGKATFKVTAKNVVGKARIEKVTLKDVKRPNSVKFFL